MPAAEPQGQARSGESNEASLPRRLREAWSRTVGAFATDDQGTARLLDRLVDFGQLSAEEARRALAEARQRIDQNKGELDRRVDESIKRAMERLSLGSDEGRDVKRLEERIAALEARLRELEVP